MSTEMPWVSEETKKAIEHRENIAKNQDFEGLFNLKDNDDFNIALFEILANKCDYNPSKLNSIQRNLFICMLLENSSQSDMILNFLQEDYPEYKIEVISALNEIGATKSAEIIKKAITLIPKDNTWFYDAVDENSKETMNKLDSEFSNYPDGKLNILYRIYSERHKKEIQTI